MASHALCSDTCWRHTPIDALLQFKMNEDIFRNEKCKLLLVRPSQGFWGFREGFLFSGIWGEGSFIFRDLGRKQGFREQGAGG